MASAESVGLCRHTGKVLTGWDHVCQSIEVIFTTSFFSRLMRPHVGSFVPKLFGELANPALAQRFRWASAMAIMLLEPRFYPTRIDMVDLDRTGATAWVIEGQYRPLGHRGDTTSAGMKRLVLASEGDRVVVAA